MEIIINLVCNPYVMGGLILGVLALFLLGDGELIRNPNKRKKKD